MSLYSRNMRCGVFFLGLLLAVGVVCGKSLKKSVFISITEETIDGMQFMHRSNMIDGKRSDIWAINDRKVSSDEYESEILEAEKRERARERQQENQAMQQRLDFLASTQRNGYKKLITVLIRDIEIILKKIVDKRLRPFFAFSSATVPSYNDLKLLKKEIIKNAQELISTDDEVLLSQMQDMLTQLEQYPLRLQNFYYDTVKNAQAQSDDTKLLKDLLNVGNENF